MKFISVLLIFLLFSSLDVNATEVLPYRQGFLGADAAYSIQLSEHRTLWLFGDTFINLAEPNAINRRGASMIANSIALRDCHTAPCVLRYVFRTKTKAGIQYPQAFFTTKNKKTALWPRDGFFYQGKVYIFLLEIKRLPPKDNDPFGFKIIGVRFIRLSPSESSPNEWKIDLLDRFARGENTAAILPGTAILRKDGQVFIDNNHYLYLIGNIDGQAYTNNPAVIQRIQLKQLQHMFSQLQTLDKNKQWRKNLALEDSHIIMSRAAMEMSVLYDKAIKSWRAIYSDFASPYIQQRQTSNLYDWSEAQSLPIMYDAMDPTSPHYDKSAFCYAAKVHIGLGGKKPILSYVCNAFDVDVLLDNMDIYIPKLVPMTAFGKEISARHGFHEGRMAQALVTE